ncbi:MAG: hypothetical protein AB3N09_11725 [Tateyamaria sp.]
MAVAFTFRKLFVEPITQLFQCFVQAHSPKSLYRQKSKTSGQRNLSALLSIVVLVSVSSLFGLNLVENQELNISFAQLLPIGLFGGLVDEVSHLPLLGEILFFFSALLELWLICSVLYQPFRGIFGEAKFSQIYNVAINTFLASCVVVCVTNVLVLLYINLFIEGSFWFHEIPVVALAGMYFLFLISRFAIAFAAIVRRKKNAPRCYYLVFGASHIALTITKFALYYELVAVIGKVFLP